MGLNWVSGFFMLIDDPTAAHVAAYIFTVSNASQGIFIFLFHIVASKRLQDHFKSSIRFPGGPTTAMTGESRSGKGTKGIRSFSSRKKLANSSS